MALSDVSTRPLDHPSHPYGVDSRAHRTKRFTSALQLLHALQTEYVYGYGYRTPHAALLCEQVVYLVMHQARSRLVKPGSGPARSPLVLLRAPPRTAARSTIELLFPPVPHQRRSTSAQSSLNQAFSPRYMQAVDELDEHGNNILAYEQGIWASMHF